LLTNQFLTLLALEMNRDALIRLGEYPKRNIILNLLKELVSVQSYMKRKSDEDILNIPKATDKSKEYAVAFVRGFAIQAFYINNLVEFLLGSMRALQITFQYGLTGTGAVAIVAHGLVSNLNLITLILKSNLFCTLTKVISSTDHLGIGRLSRGC